MTVFNTSRMAIILISIYLMAGCSKKPEDIAEKMVKAYYSAVEKNDGEAVFSIVDSTQPLPEGMPFTQAATSKKVYREGKRIAVRGGIDKLEIMSVDKTGSLDDPYCIVSLKIVYGDGSSEEVVETVKNLNTNPKLAWVPF